MKKTKVILSGQLLLSLSFPSTSLAADTTEVLPGDGSLETPYIIEDSHSLLVLGRLMEAKDFYTRGKYFRLTRDISINSHVLDPDGSLCGDSLSLDAWTPIGRDSYGKGFYGVFDGGGHTISGLYINDASAKNSGLFGYIDKEGEVRNLKLADSYICGGEATGGIIGLSRGTVMDCENKATVRAVGPTHQSGGIVGKLADGIIIRCRNAGHISGWTYPDEYGSMWNCETGGIAGSAAAKIDSCINVGYVKALDWGSVGGITGSVSSSVTNSVNEGVVTSDHEAAIGGIAGNNSSYVSGCINRGRLIATCPGSCVGGIIGSNNFNSRIYGSENHGEIICDVDSVYVGGIVGNLNGGRQYDTYYTPKVYTSRNSGNISTGSEKSMCGGIAGKSYCGEIYECTNNGHIVSRNLAGGILPLGEFHTNIYDCTNEGIVEGCKSTGGIAGKLIDEVRNCINAGSVGTIENNSDCGGIVGWLSGGTARNCVNTGEVTSGMNVGGIVGSNNSRSTIIASYNAGYVHSSTTGSRIGGVAGGSGTLRNCYNAGIVRAEASGIMIGGVTHNLWVNWDSHGNRSGSTASNCYNMGDIIVDSIGCTVGNIAASYENSNASQLFKNCYYLKNAIFGLAGTDADNKNKNITALDKDAFRNLATDLNKVEFYESVPYIQGYWRPLLLKDGAGTPTPMQYYRVAAFNGDSVLIDLGLPAENVFFDTDSTGIILDAYNVGYDNHIRRAKLVDMSDFTLDTPLRIDGLYYSRHLNGHFNTVCLPVGIDASYLPEGCHMAIPHRLEGDTLRLGYIESAKAGMPFLLDGRYAGGKWTLMMSDVNFVPLQPVGHAMMEGTFSSTRDFPAGGYLMDEEGDYLKKAVVGDSLSSFRAYVSLGDSDTDKIGLSLNSGQTSTINEITSGNPVVAVHGLSIHVDDVKSGQLIEVYDTHGRSICRQKSGVGATDIALPATGIYLIRIGTWTAKVMAPGI
ncbi:hypothetical protein [uncultured Muribaculum sp.]|uniref:hypothetical protein n=1 Tax=uncultured Muribaculum sp. TaxID=1918613 RepID=UPI0025DAFFB5|nr:hypothetical protein [uncultured Muribaculum sp.]